MGPSKKRGKARGKKREERRRTKKSNERLKIGRGEKEKTKPLKTGRLRE